MKWDVYSELTKLSEWAGHKIFFNKKWKIIKIPKRLQENYKNTKELIEYAKNYFGKYIHDTLIYPYWKDSYILEQDFIDWKHLAPEDLLQNWIKEEFQKIIDLHNESIAKNWIWLDLVWYEWAIKWTLYNLYKYKWTIFDKYIITPFFKLLARKRTDIYWKILDFWKSWCSPELANIMIDKDNNIKIIDLSLTSKKWLWMKAKVRAQTIELYNKFYLKKYYKSL